MALVRLTGATDRRRTVVGALVAVAILSVVALGFDRLSRDLLVGVVVLLVLGVVAVPVLTWVAKREGEPQFAHLLLWGAAAKVIGTLVRYFVIVVVYKNSADAANYSNWGAEISRMLRAGDFSFLSEPVAGRDAETERIALVVGLVYAVTGVSRYAASFVFSAICFAGQVLMWRAFRRAVPTGDSKRYAILLLFLPSMLFWPSSIGKDALMVGCVGLVSYGAAQILGEKVSLAGIAFFIAGAAGLMAIRPHMSLIAVVALTLGSVVGSITGIKQRGASKSAVVRLAALVVLVGVGVVGVTQLGKLFAEDGATDTGITAALEKTQSQTSMGGSEYASVAVSSPVDLPMAVVTVLIRPFPWEARNVNGLIAASEGVLFVGLAIAGRRRLVAWAKELPRNPYLIYCAAYSFVFIILFSYIGNFGILARQRTQMMPLVLVCLAMPAVPKLNRRERLEVRTSRRKSRTVSGAEPTISADETLS